MAVNARGTGTRYLVAAVVAAALAIGAAGCSSDSKSADDTPTVTAAPRSDKGTTEADLNALIAAVTIRDEHKEMYFV